MRTCLKKGNNMLNKDQQLLVSKHINLVYWIANKLGYTDEDSIQYGMLGLCLAAERYDSKRGIMFSTYAYSYISHWLKGTYSDIKHKQRIESNIFINIEDVEDILAESNYNSEELFEVINSAKPKLREIFILLLNGETRKEISKKLNISEPTISRWIHKFREEYNNGK